MATTIVKATKSSVPGQYLGYGLQDVRLCHHLLKAPPGSSVSLEYIEDTAVHLAGQPLLLEQSKSALANNPLSDSAFDLWKSFANWASLCVEGTIDPASTIFRYYACPKKDGKLAEQMHAARTEAEVDGLLAIITKKVTSTNQLKGCNPKISEFLSAGTVICRKIILNFELLCEDEPLEAIREVLRFAVFEDSVDDFCAYAIGAAKNWIADLIAAGQTPVIDAAAFRKHVQSFVRKHGILGLLVPTTTSPSAADVQKIVSAAPLAPVRTGFAPASGPGSKSRPMRRSRSRRPVLGTPSMPVWLAPISVRTGWRRGEPYWSAGRRSSLRDET